MLQERLSKSNGALAVCLLLALAAQVDLLHPLFEPDEGRNALVALEMARSGDYVVPRLEGMPYLDKPALFFGWVAGSLRVFGRNEAAARLPALLSGWLAIALTGWFGARLFGRRARVPSMLVLATAPLAVAFNQIVIFDSSLALLVLGSVVGFFLATETVSENRPDDTYWALLGWGAAALAVLVKGPVGLLLPLLIVLPYAIWRRRTASVFRLSGILAFVLIVTPWLLAVESREPGFLRYALLTETWSRLTTRELDRAGPIWTYVPVLLAGSAPWIFGLATTVRARWRSETSAAARRGAVLLLLWIVLPFVFFSLSQSKRPQYLVPVLPALALASAWCVDHEALRSRFARSAGVALIALGAVLVLVATDVVSVDTKNASEAALAVYRSAALRLGIVALLAGAVAALSSRRARAPLMALAMPIILLPLAGGAALEQASSGRSARELARQLQPRLGVNRLVGVEAFSPSLAFYLDRPITISTVDGFPTTSNYIMSRYRELVREAPVLQPADWWRAELETCERPTFFLARTKHQQIVATLAGAMPEVARNRKFAVYGPCRSPAASTVTPRPSGS